MLGGYLGVVGCWEGYLGVVGCWEGYHKGGYLGDLFVRPWPKKKGNAKSSHEATCLTDPELSGGSGAQVVVVVDRKMVKLIGKGQVELTNLMFKTMFSFAVDVSGWQSLEKTVWTNILPPLNSQCYLRLMRGSFGPLFRTQPRLPLSFQLRLWSLQQDQWDIVSLAAMLWMSPHWNWFGHVSVAKIHGSTDQQEVPVLTQAHFKGGHEEKS